MKTIVENRYVQGTAFFINFTIGFASFVTEVWPLAIVCGIGMLFSAMALHGE